MELLIKKCVSYKKVSYKKACNFPGVIFQPSGSSLKLPRIVVLVCRKGHAFSRLL